MFPDSPVCCADMFRIFRTPSFATLYRLESPVWISALRGPAVRKLVDSEAVQLSLFALPRHSCESRNPEPEQQND